MTRRWPRARRPALPSGGSICPRTGAVITVVALGVVLAACTSGPSVPGVASINSSSPSSHRKTKPKSYPHSPLGLALCMRAHGIADFPEPSAAGAIQVSPSQGSDLNPSNPRFRAAFNACRSVFGPQPSPAQRAAQLAQALKFAHCMRAHGVTNFPDPGGGGGFVFKSAGGGLNPNAPTFQSASRACSGRFGKRRGVASVSRSGSKQ